MPPQNFVVGDENGNIGWTIAGAIPLSAATMTRAAGRLERAAGLAGLASAAAVPAYRQPREWSHLDAQIHGSSMARHCASLVMAVTIWRASDANPRRPLRRRVTLSQRTCWPYILMIARCVSRAMARPVAGPAAATPRTASWQEYRRLVQQWMPRATAESVGYRLVRAFRNEVRRRVSDVLLSPARDAYEAGMEIYA